MLVRAKWNETNISCEINTDHNNSIKNYIYIIFYEKNSCFEKDRLSLIKTRIHNLHTSSDYKYEPKSRCILKSRVKILQLWIEMYVDFINKIEDDERGSSKIYKNLTWNVINRECVFW